MALNLVPCFTPAESPESNGTAEAFVKTFKRDYVRVNPIANAATTLSLIDTCNTGAPAFPGWPTAHPREYIMLSSKPAACPV